MNDIENELYTIIAKALRAAYSGIFVTGTYTPAPPKFPCVFFEQIDSSTSMMDGGNRELLTAVTFQADVFSNKAKNKSECKAIISTIDGLMVSYGFRRSFLNTIPNEDPTIYRMTARYTAAVGGTTIYRR